MKRKKENWLTEIYSQVLSLFNHCLEHDASDQLNSILGFLLDQPLQDFFFFLERTFVDVRHVSLEVNQHWILADAVKLGDRVVLSLHKSDAMSIAVIVNVLKLIEYSSALITINGGFICELQHVSQFKFLGSIQGNPKGSSN